MFELLCAFILGLLVWATFPALVRLAIWCVKALLIVGMVGALIALAVALSHAPRATKAPVATVAR